VYAVRGSSPRGPLYDLIENIDAFMRIVAYARYSPPVWRAVISKVIFNSLRLKNPRRDPRLNCIRCQATLGRMRLHQL
jgi:hypothetical protein